MLHEFITNASQIKKEFHLSNSEYLELLKAATLNMLFVDSALSSNKSSYSDDEVLAAYKKLSIPSLERIAANLVSQRETARKTVFVTLVRSPIGYNKKQKRTVLALGLRRMHQTVEHRDSMALPG